MDTSKLAVKFFFAEGAAPHSETLVPVFHRWIQTHAMPDHQLVDVADYQHVVAGPGTVLVAHEANITTDQSHNQPGLIYIRKTPLAGDLAERLTNVFSYCLQACKMLEDDGSLQPPVRFRTDNPIIRIYDRLVAPNDARTFDSLRPALAAVVRQLFGQSATLSHKPDDMTLFEVLITASANDPVSTVLPRLQKSPPALHLEPPEYSL